MCFFLVFAGCSAPGCTQAASGYQLVVIWLKPEDGSNPETFDAFDLSEGAYITTSDGSRQERFSAGCHVENGLFVAFAVPFSAAELELNWPNNSPITLTL